MIADARALSGHESSERPGVYRQRPAWTTRTVACARALQRSSHEDGARAIASRAEIVAPSTMDAMSARDMTGTLGRLGGRVRARRLSTDERKRIATLGGHARRQSLVAAGRIADNFRYLAAVDALRGAATTVTREHDADGPLPGLYPGRR
jgi:hypothetical protein